MMATGHSLSAVAIGLGVASLPFVGYDITYSILISILLAGAALLPDWDHPGAIAATTFGFASRGIAKLIDLLSLTVYLSTKKRHEFEKTSGHRTFTHTAVFAIICGLLFYSLSFISIWVNYTLTFILVCLALRGLAPRFSNRNGKPFLWILGAGLIAAMHFQLISPLPDLVLAVILTIGMIIHVLGDCITNTGAPLLWPIVIDNKRWYRIKFPLNFETNSDFEKYTMWNIFRITIVLILLYRTIL